MDSSTWDERYSGTDLVWSATPNRWVVRPAIDALVLAARTTDTAPPTKETQS